MTSSIPPTYEQQQESGAVQLEELESQSRAAQPLAASAHPSVPIPSANNGICHPVDYIFDPPAHLHSRGLGGIASGALGRTHEVRRRPARATPSPSGADRLVRPALQDTLKIVRRAFPGALADVPDSKIVLAIPADSEDLHTRKPTHWVRLSAGWWQIQSCALPAAAATDQSRERPPRTRLRPAGRLPLAHARQGRP